MSSEIICLHLMQSSFRNEHLKKLLHLLKPPLSSEERNELLRLLPGLCKPVTAPGAILSGPRVAIQPLECTFLHSEQRALMRIAESHWKFPEDTSFDCPGFNQLYTFHPSTFLARGLGWEQKHKHGYLVPTCYDRGGLREELMDVHKTNLQSVTLLKTVTPQ